MVGTLLKKAKDVSTFMKRRKVLKGIPSTKPTKKQLEDFYKRWQRENKVSSGTLSEEGKKKQVKKFVDIRKRTKPAWKKKKFD
tara:strand:- start:165 stop:413 length:249 start_codon:yes stop_codon:yes gene_type:complete